MGGFKLKGYRVTVLRHGNTRANEEGIYIGRTDYPLSERGAAELAAKMDTYIYPTVDKVYSSPLLRCTESAEILFPDTEIQVVEDLAEMNFGKFEGKKAMELTGTAEFEAWLKGGVDNSPPGGESVQDVDVRIYKAICIIFGDMMEHDYQHCAIMTHGGIVSNMLAGFGVPKIDPQELIPLPGEGYDLHWTAEDWQRSGVFEILGMAPYDRVTEEDLEAEANAEDEIEIEDEDETEN